jgi:hypothetical protein
LIFTLIWSSLSILFAVIWAIPTSSSITGYTSDLSKSLPQSPYWFLHYTNTMMCSLHRWLGCRLRCADFLVQQQQLWQCLGLGQCVLEPSQHLRSMAGCSGFLFLVHVPLARYCYLGHNHCPPS